MDHSKKGSVKIVKETKNKYCKKEKKQKTNIVKKMRNKNRKIVKSNM